VAAIAALVLLFVVIDLAAPRRLGRPMAGVYCVDAALTLSLSLDRDRERELEKSCGLAVLL
jgi:hypothetical protein